MSKLHGLVFASFCCDQSSTEPCLTMLVDLWKVSFSICLSSLQVQVTASSSLLYCYNLPQPEQSCNKMLSDIPLCCHFKQGYVVCDWVSGSRLFKHDKKGIWGVALDFLFYQSAKRIIDESSKRWNWTLNHSLFFVTWRHIDTQRYLFWCLVTSINVVVLHPKSYKAPNNCLPYACTCYHIML